MAGLGCPPRQISAKVVKYRFSSSEDAGYCRAGAYVQLRKDSLRVMSCSVLADHQDGSDSLVTLAVGNQPSYHLLSRSKSRKHELALYSQGRLLADQDDPHRAEIAGDAPGAHRIGTPNGQRHRVPHRAGLTSQDPGETVAHFVQRRAIEDLTHRRRGHDRSVLRPEHQERQTEGFEKREG